MKNKIITALCAVFLSNAAIAQSNTQTIKSKPISYTEYTDKSELFAEYPALVKDIPARFTAHLTRTGAHFKPYSDATVVVTLTIDGKTAYQYTNSQPESPGIYRFQMKAELAGKGIITIDVKTADYTDHFIIKNVKVYADAASALSAKGDEPVEEQGVKTYIKEKSWKVDFATAVVGGKRKKIYVPKTALLKDNNETAVYVQVDPENFRKQVVLTGKERDSQILITSGLQSGERIVILGAENIDK
ncbi:hypothetical protein OZ666_11070 [Elizabethkingia sp. HX QKY]|uniref:hypothetical protein n=1 Tax=Elizabethkingia TaxID=308865 RepID=UPI002A23BDDF|nr:hypothetical protein [Elizabethkingia sp. HX QKY]MDX8572224.1 hypothetical protein [Elizabethkingia sp. HX QKY]